MHVVHVFALVSLLGTHMHSLLQNELTQVQCIRQPFDEDTGTWTRLG